MLDHITLLNLNLLYVKGRSDLALKLEIIKKIIAITILIVSLRWGLIGVCWGRVAYSIIATVMNTYYTKKLIQLSFLQQMKDILPFLLVSIIMGISVSLCIAFISTPILQLFVGILIGAIIYLGLSLIFFRNILIELKSLIFH